MKKSTRVKLLPSSEQRFAELVRIMARLRGPAGCPWDKHQDHRSLLPYLFSEANEVKQAVRKKDWENLKEELGDILLQIVFHSQIAREAGRFDIGDVVMTISEKLKRRHPHVFGGPRLKTPAAVRRQWESIKRQEKQERTLRRPTAVNK